MCTLRRAHAAPGAALAVGPSHGGLCRSGGDGSTAVGLHRPDGPWSGCQLGRGSCGPTLFRRNARLGVLRVYTCVLRHRLGWWRATSLLFGTKPAFACAVRLTRYRSSGATGRLIACWWRRVG